MRSLFLIFFCILFCGAQAEFAHAKPVEESALIAIPEDLSSYEKPFKKLPLASQWKIRRHALRYAPLHPSVWSLLKVDKTYNRTMVPIRPFFLRVSEDLSFKLKDIEFEFQFKPAKKRYMMQTPHQKDPVLEIGLGGVYQARPLEKDGRVNHGYAVRLSAFPPVISGLYFRSGTEYKLLTEPDSEIEVGKSYKVKVVPSKLGFKLYLNDQVFLQSKNAKVESGLISLQTSWHPISMKSLEIKGSLNGKPWQDSGLYNVRAAKGLKNAQ